MAWPPRSRGGIRIDIPHFPGNGFRDKPPIRTRKAGKAHQIYLLRQSQRKIHFSGKVSPETDHVFPEGSPRIFSLHGNCHAGLGLVSVPAGAPGDQSRAPPNCTEIGISISNFLNPPEDDLYQGTSRHASV